MKKQVHYSIKILGSLAAAIPMWLVAQNSPKFSMKGGARSVLANSELQVKDSIPDKVTAPKNAGGYALIDLGFNIRPNKNTEILGMIRINNRFGGFWGAGVTFNVRQLWLKGVIADKVRYQLGDINLKQTPFTFWNHDEDRCIQQPAVFDLQRDIVNYESFYVPGTWRQQGAAVDFGLESLKLKSEWNFRGYLTRLNATNFGSQPERLHVGSTANWVWNKKATLAYNLSRIFDVKETAAQPLLFQNTVQTLSWELRQAIGKKQFTLGGEAGNSSYRIVHDTASPHLQDFFVHGFVKVAPESKRWEAEAGYINVGPEFRSMAAQSKLIDYNAQPLLYNRYTQLQIDRPLHLLDFIGNANLYRTGINTKLMVYNPMINNVLPYGIATFNRKGFYAKAKYNIVKNTISMEAQHWRLSEILGQGTPELKKMDMTRLDVNCDAGKLLGMKKQAKLHVSACNQNTRRKSPRAYEELDLSSLLLSAGFELEVMNDIDLLGGYTALQAKGSDLMAIRNDYTEVIDFAGFSADQKHSTAAAGFRVRFGGKTYLALMYQRMQFQNKAQAFRDYSIGQMQAIYNMTF
ncbi:MAG: hypothetical protein FJY15_05885 [Bacteroidetes bacterium]|nr:hypothetical protein [Bacteroidota bacterium]